MEGQFIVCQLKRLKMNLLDILEGIIFPLIYSISNASTRFRRYSSNSAFYISKGNEYNSDVCIKAIKVLSSFL